MARPSNPDTSFRFDEAGNVILKKPEVLNKVIKLTDEQIAKYIRKLMK